MLTAVLEVHWVQILVIQGLSLAVGMEFLGAPLSYRISSLSLPPYGSQGFSSSCGLCHRETLLRKGALRSPEYKGERL